jgi:hypothetical protein
MVKKNILRKIRYAFQATTPVVISFLWACFFVPLYALPVENKTTEIVLTDENKIIRQEDVDAARLKAEEVRNNADTARREIELFISHLESDTETTKVFLDKPFSMKRSLSFLFL